MVQRHISHTEWLEECRCVCVALPAMTGSKLPMTQGIMFAMGSVIEDEVASVGSACLDDMGLDAPDGFSVWEGTFVPNAPDHEGTVDGTSPTGTFRPLTHDEWECVMGGVSPWVEDLNDQQFREG